MRAAQSAQSVHGDIVAGVQGIAAEAMGGEGEASEAGELWPRRLTQAQHRYSGLTGDGSAPHIFSHQGGLLQAAWPHRAWPPDPPRNEVDNIDSMAGLGGMGMGNMGGGVGWGASRLEPWPDERRAWPVPPRAHPDMAVYVPAKTIPELPLYTGQQQVLRDAPKKGFDLSGERRAELSGEPSGELSGERRGDLSGERRGELGDERRGELGDERRGELGGERRGDLGDERRGELGDERRGELGDERRGGLGDERRAQLSGERARASAATAAPPAAAHAPPAPLSKPELLENTTKKKTLKNPAAERVVAVVATPAPWGDEHDGLSEHPPAAVLLLVLGSLMTVSLGALVACRARAARRRRARPRLAVDADYLVNGMYL
ncbi:unnamed protein product [Parnassius mnemosyne]|uniref:Uncharacterized protein n=1 Tax=Parnassius mnemosyne TaxID=213953 RepID=A0AAV1M178_9NEOP